MPDFAPRDHLATHDVTNQPPLIGDLDLFSDPAIREAFDRAIATGATPPAAQKHRDHLAAFGKIVGRVAMAEHGRLAHENKPVLRAFDSRGRRLDEVEYHPSYHQLMETGLANGVASYGWTQGAGGHTTHGALLYLMGWADTSVCCPMSMSYAAAAVLKGHDWTKDQWLPGLLRAAYDQRCLPMPRKKALTMGMAMTEKQGGSDLRANSTKAKIGAEGEAELYGHKWFCSAPMSDGFLTLAYEEAGLSCFLVPKWRPDGTRNQIEIQRLKDKMGDVANASSEIEYRGAWAKRVGEPGRGIATILTMAHHTRFDCISGSATGMRRAVYLANHFAHHRSAFQKKLIDLPLMENTLADLALESEAAIALSMMVGAGFDAPAGSAPHLLSRILTPVAKYWVCKRQPMLVSEALEAMGGVGFVEENTMARLYRTAPLNGIWEGSGNVIALDIQRALKNQPVREAFIDAINDIVKEIAVLESLGSWLIEAGEGNERLFAERAALIFAAIALPEGPLREAWIALRLLNPSHIWGAQADKIDRAFLLQRLQGWEIS